MFIQEIIINSAYLGYRDDSLETVKRNEQQYEIPLKIFSYKELYGWTMDEIVREVRVPLHLAIKKNNKQ